MYDSKERFFSMAETYDMLAQYLVPKYDFLQDEAINILDFDPESKLSIIDLGAGTGIFLEKVLRKYKNAKCYYLDFSYDFKKVAQNRLNKYEGKVEYILTSLSDNWHEVLPEKVDAIFSMSAIHHLSNENKKDLFKRCYSILNPSGWLINIDEMKTLRADSYYKSLLFWWEYFEGNKKNIPKDKTVYLSQWEKHFENWKVRNIENINEQKQEGDDMHESFSKQLDWLDEIGFKNVDLFIKYYLWCIIGGKKEC